MDDTISREEDGTINAGYAVWRELIAELIAFELDDLSLIHIYLNLICDDIHLFGLAAVFNGKTGIDGC